MDRYDKVALDIIVDVQTRTCATPELHRIVAARLRTFSEQLFSEFWRDLDKLVPRHGLSRAEHEKQREQQKDHDEERQDGWSA